ncbi:hypothetical protein M8J77_013406 [Diaphorina citri]|nr:hypothetical protein M8J77_013406 [Diaphorina citri]
MESFGMLAMRGHVQSQLFCSSTGSNHDFWSQGVSKHSLPSSLTPYTKSKKSNLRLRCRDKTALKDGLSFYKSSRPAIDRRDTTMLSRQCGRFSRQRSTAGRQCVDTPLRRQRCTVE